MNERINDISLYEKIFSHFRYWQDFISMLFHLKKTFKNSGYVLSRAFKNDFPINLIFTVPGVALLIMALIILIKFIFGKHLKQIVNHKMRVFLITAG